MALPPSFKASGFGTPTQEVQAGRKYRRLMVGTCGGPSTGKTEFIWSAPGPGLFIPFDRNFDATLDNSEPPASRQDIANEWGFKVIAAPKATQATQDVYMEYWKNFYKVYSDALANLDARTVALDGDSDSYELQRLAAFGQLAGVVQLRYQGTNAARRAMVAKAWDSGKIIIFTNKMEKDFQVVRDANNNPVMDDSGKPKKDWDGESYRRQGYDDHEYLWHLQIQHLFAPSRPNTITGKMTKPKWGLKILICKANRALEGNELWGADCNFEGLVNYVYPHIDRTEWGYK